jgi:hypothetical protein
LPPKAPYPKALLKLPPKLSNNEPYPNAELLPPVVVYLILTAPTAVLPAAEPDGRASKPIAVLKI